MLDKLGTDIEEILKLVKKCPSELQEVALRTILDNWFKINAVPATTPAGTPAGGTGTPPPPTDLPQSIAPWMIANSLTQVHLQKVYHPVGSNAQLMIADIPGTGKASKQISLAVLLSVRQALGGGSFGCGLEELRQMCLHYNCYDTANFASNLNSTKNKLLFKSRKKGEDIELSGPGTKKAAEVIKSTVVES
jgi:hypothetical protein